MSHFPDRRTDPVAYQEHWQWRLEDANAKFRDGGMSEAVYKATLHGLGYRGQAITTEVNLNWPRQAK